MSQMIKPKFVAGVVDVDPNLTMEQNRENHYAFWEIDTTDENTHNLVIETYTRFGIDFVSQRIGKGYHYFGEKIHYLKWKEWHNELIRLVGNKEFPALTIRITKKYPEEIFERPVYHQVNNPPSNNHRALMHFLNKEMKGKNQWNHLDAAHNCGLDKYYKVVPYPLCPICLVSGYDDLEEHAKKIHGVT